jgi:hypothetical protein
MDVAVLRLVVAVVEVVGAVEEEEEDELSSVIGIDSEIVSGPRERSAEDIANCCSRKSVASVELLSSGISLIKRRRTRSRSE